MIRTPHYGRSPWIDRYPRSRVPSHPQLKGHVTADVAIVGGGMTGCVTAYTFAASGLKVVLLEAGQLGRGSTGSSAGWMADDPGAPFVDVERALGLRTARRAWQLWRRAALDFSALIKRLDLHCYLEPRDNLLVAATPEQAIRMRKEQKSRRAAGLEAPSITPQAIASESAITGVAGVRTHQAATLDPYRAALGLAAAAVDRSARFFERSPVRKTTFQPRWVDVVTAGGTVRADRVIVATGVPTSLFKSLIRHFWLRTSFLAMTEPIPAKIRHQLGNRKAVIRDSAAPPHLVRWVDDERLVVAGADSRLVPPRLKDRTLVQRTGQLMYELSTIYPDISGLAPEYGWEAPYAQTADGLPYIGPHRNFPRHLFAFGDASHSVTGAYLASRILLRHYREEIESADEVFGFVTDRLRT
jgi:glycine/D-amino acid oxidase-like deaminating enzyme